MDLLKKCFPASFGTQDVAGLVIRIIIYVVAMVVGGFLLALVGLITGWIPIAGIFIGWLLGLIGALVELYCVAGIVILILDYLKLLK